MQDSKSVQLCFRLYWIELVVTREYTIIRHQTVLHQLMDEEINVVIFFEVLICFVKSPLRLNLKHTNAV